ncbi:MAG: hypothetical protein WCF04_09120 [Candidatus Nanopelagicales bacterium]
MAEAHIPAELEPHVHEHGLASGDVTQLATDIDRAWELFEATAREADLSAPARKHGWTGRDIVARVGHWEFSRTLDDLLREAHDGDADFVDAEAEDARILSRTATMSDGDILDGVTAARHATADWLASDGPATWGLVHTSSVLGPLPVLTVVNAACYQLATCALDLERCGATAPDELLHTGLTAMVDSAGGLAARKHVAGAVIARTSSVIVGAGARGGHWRTREFSTMPTGPAIEAEARVILDVTSGHASVPHLYRAKELRLHDLSGLIHLAPVLDGVPGLPPLGAIGRALQVVDAVGGLFGRFRR